MLAAVTPLAASAGNRPARAPRWRGPARVLLLLGCASAGTTLAAQEPGGSAAPRPQKEQTPGAPEPEVPEGPFRPPGLGTASVLRAAAAALELAEPGPEHARLAALAGDYTIELRMATPSGGEPVRAEGRARAATLLGGRYLQVDLRVPLPAPGKVAAEGEGTGSGGEIVLEAIYLFGFDRLRGEYEASWRDSLSTWSTGCAGTPDPKDPQRLLLAGRLSDPASPQGRPFRLEFAFVPEGGFAITVVETGGEAPRPVMWQRFVPAPAADRAPGAGDGRRERGR